jgi:hypothetical protein
LVPPKHSTSTPAFQVISAGATPSEATALAKRAPSMCTRRPCSRAQAEIAATSAGRYTVPTSVPCVSVTTRGLG